MPFRFRASSCLWLLLCAFSLWAPSRANATNTCAINGGTALGCYQSPAYYKATGSTNQVYPDMVSAVTAAANNFMGPSGPCPQCTYGLLTTPFTSLPPGSVCTPVSLSSCLGVYTDVSTPQYRNNMAAIIWGLAYDPPHNTPHYYVADVGGAGFYPYCPAGTTTAFDYPTPPPPGSAADTYCRPTTTALATTDRQDTSHEGGSCGLNPIDLPTLSKLDRVVDYTSDAPFPIVWERFFSGQRGDWAFTYDRKLVFRNETSSSVSVMATRADGSQLLFSAPWTIGSTLPDTWSVVGANATLIQATLTDTKDGTGNVATFTLTTPDDIAEHYDAHGVLLQLEDRNGNHIGFAHDGKGRITQVVDDFGHHLNVSYTAVSASTDTYNWATYDPANPTAPPHGVNANYYPTLAAYQTQERVSQIDDGTRTVNYTFTFRAEPTGTYPGTMLLTQVSPSDADGPIKYDYGTGGGYSFNGTAKTSSPAYNDLTGITDEASNQWATYYYNSAGKVSSASHGNGLWQNYTFGSLVYDGVGDSFQYSSSANKTAGYFSPCPASVCGGGWGTQARSITYSGYGNPTSILDQTYNAGGTGGAITTRTYDEPRGLPLTETEASGTALARTTTWTWDPTWHLPLTEVAPIQVAGVAGTRTTTWTRDSHGNATSVLVHTSTGELDRSSSATYDSAGNLLTSTDTLGHTTSYTYGYDGRLASVEDASAATTTVDGYTSRGKPTQWTDPNGLITKINYDAHDRPIRVDRGSAGGGSHWETATLAYTPTDFLADLTSPNGRHTHFRYDAAHRLVGVDLKDTAGSLLGTIDYTLDRRSLKTAEVWKDASGTTVQSRAATYDAYSRLATDVGAAQPAETTTYTYDNQHHPVQVQDALVHKTKQTFDALGRALVITDALNHTATLAYDVSDAVVSATDPNGHATTYTYNGFGELTQLASPDSGTWAFTVDSGGRRTTTTDPRGVVKTTTYDALDRATQVVYSDTGVASGLSGFTYGSETQTFAYDSCANGIGHLCSMSDGSGTTSYSYDLWGRVIAKNTTPAGSSVGLNVGYAYDSQGRLTTLVYPSGKVLTLTRDSASRVASLAYDGQTVVQSIAYRPVGEEVAGWSWGAVPAGTVAYHYDLDGQVSEIDDADTRTYGYDVAGRLTGINDPVHTTGVQVYGYDALDRLTSANLGSYLAPISYTYDNTGNRLTNTDGAGTGATHTTTWTVAPTSNRTTAEKVGSAAATSWTGDATGNLIADGAGLTLSYDAKNRLASTVGPVGTTLYRHNAVGQRTEKAGTLGTELYAYDQTGRLLGVYDASGDVVEELVYLDGWRPVATVRASGGTSTVYPILTDHLGAPRKVLDPSTGSAVWSWDAKEPFGSQPPTGSFAFQARFPGQRFDPETGLVANGFRVYSAAAGRYVQSDPIGLGAGWNTFSIDGANPLSNVDYDGRNPLFLTAIVGAGLGAIVGGVGAKLQGLDWRQGMVEGAIVGGVAGLTLGLAGPAVATALSGEYLGGSIVGGAAAGGISSLAGDAAGQGYEAAIGQRSQYDPIRGAFVATAGALVGGFSLRPGSADAVTTWARKGVAPEVCSGTWVMTGTNSFRNFAFSGIGRMYPKANSTTVRIPNELLSYPPGWESLKGYLGQRVVK